MGALGPNLLGRSSSTRATFCSAPTRGSSAAPPPLCQWPEPEPEHGG